MSLSAVQLTIHGIVQGVGYRYFCYRTAVELGLVGWARNMPDGTVMITAEGDRGTLEILIKELKVGPTYASISRVDVDWIEYTGRYKMFDIRG